MVRKEWVTGDQDDFYENYFSEYCVSSIEFFDE